jgi:hypothetical protein
MRLHHIAITAILLALTGPAHAQTAGGTSGPAGSGLGATPSPTSPLGTSPGNALGTVSPDSGIRPPPTSPTTGSSVPPATIAPPVAGAPNTSTPGSIGTGASPSGLPGDDPLNPGFPTGPTR